MEILSLSYYVMTRRMDYNRQITEEIEKRLSLYQDYIHTDDSLFPLETVFDVSIKKTINAYNLLYLHTNKGVYPYIVKEDAEEFIKLVKERLKS